jgi:hypothetical protein
MLYRGSVQIFSMQENNIQNDNNQRQIELNLPKYH